MSAVEFQAVLDDLRKANAAVVDAENAMSEATKQMEKAREALSQSRNVALARKQSLMITLEKLIAKDAVMPFLPNVIK